MNGNKSTRSGARGPDGQLLNAACLHLCCDLSSPPAPRLLFPLQRRNGQSWQPHVGMRDVINGRVRPLLEATPRLCLQNAPASMFVCEEGSEGKSGDAASSSEDAAMTVMKSGDALRTHRGAEADVSYVSEKFGPVLTSGKQHLGSSLQLWVTAEQRAVLSTSRPQQINPAAVWTQMM